jgi:hypothetical protein
MHVGINYQPSSFYINIIIIIIITSTKQSGAQRAHFLFIISFLCCPLTAGQSGNYACCLAFRVMSRHSHLSLLRPLRLA